MADDYCINKINSFLKFGITPGLERIEKLLSMIGDPQKRLKFVHVAGTNGKGSTCAFIASILKSKGYKTGLFISPFILDFKERIQINGKMISESDLKRTLDYITRFTNKMKKNNQIITEFELITAIAFKYFYDANCDIIVLETGLGGRLDSTNIIEAPLVSVITHISFDHTDILGTEIDEITYEKAGIIKQNGITVLYPQQEEKVISIIENTVKERNNKLIYPKMSDIKILSEDIDKTTFTYKGTNFNIHLLGEHQIKNAITAICAVDSLKNIGLDIELEHIQNGLENTKFPARLEVLSKKPVILLDGAHNADGALALKHFLGKHLDSKNTIGIIGMLKDKDISKILSILSPCFKKIITVDINNKRAMKAEDLADIGKKYFKYVISSKNIDDAIDISFSLIEKDHVNLVVCGSLYLAGEIRDKILYKINN